MTRTALLVVLLGMCASAPAPAATTPPPRDLNERADFTQRLGAQAPMTIAFRAADGREVTLADVAQGKPLLLALGYYACPNLCGIVLQGMAQAVAGLPLRPGRDYQVVFVSIDPQETPRDALASTRTLAHKYPSAHVDHWHLLTGTPASITALAAALGFRYFYDPRNRQYAHPAGVTVLTGTGRVAQYFFGASYPPQSLRLALVDASRGHLGNIIDQLVLLCCGYDPSTGRYSLLIGRVTQGLGVVFVLVLSGALLRLTRRSVP